MPDYRSPEAQRYRKDYKRARWLKIAAHQLRTNPLCARCQRQGRIRNATICHHVIKAQKDDPATFHDGPFESLCKPCHDGPAQQVERIGFENTVGLDGFPTDPRHPALR